MRLLSILFFAAGVACADGQQPLLIVNSLGRVIALDPATGRLEWSFERYVFTQPEIEGPAVYLCPSTDRALSEQSLYALDRATGDVRWSARPGNVKRLLPAGRTLLLKTQYRGAAGVDARTGALLWRVRHQRGDPVLRVGPRLSLWCNGAELVALDSRNGLQRWSRRIRRRTPPHDSDRFLFRDWCCETNGVAAIDRTADKAQLRLLDPRSGRVRWSAQVAARKASVRVGARRVMVCDERFVTAYDLRNGRRLWRTAASQVHAMDLLRSRALISTKDHRLQLIDLDDGSDIWTRVPDLAPEHWPWHGGFFGDVVIAPFDDAQVAYDLRTGQPRWSTRDGFFFLPVAGRAIFYPRVADGEDKQLICLTSGGRQLWRRAIPSFNGMRHRD